MTMRFELKSRPLGATPFLLNRRKIAPEIQSRLQDAMPHFPEGVSVETEPSHLRRGLTLALEANVPELARKWLVDDVASCAQWLVEISGIDRLKVRLEKMNERMCPKFHVDAVSFRLLCTYHGPGTEWTDPNTAFSINFDEPYDQTLVHHFPTGSIAIYGGADSASGLRPLWHRSPEVAQGKSRLLLCMDAATNRPFGIFRREN